MWEKFWQGINPSSTLNEGKVFMPCLNLEKSPYYILAKPLNLIKKKDNSSRARKAHRERNELIKGRAGGVIKDSRWPI